MKKILFIINSLGGGGAERVVLTLCSSMIDVGHEVHLIVLNNSSNYEIDEQINLHSLNLTKNKYFKVFNLFSGAYLLKKLVYKLEKSKNFDLITSHLPYSNYLSFFANLKNHYAVLHSTRSREIGGNMFKLFVLKRLNNNQKFITVSDGVKDDFLNVCKVNVQSIHTIYNPFNIDEIQQKAQEKNIHLPSAKYIVHIGRFSKEKRHDRLIDIFSYVKSNCKLILIGEGEEKESVINQINLLKLQDKVQLVAWQNNPFSWLKNAELLVLTSDSEGLPTVLIEALICCTPIISTNCKSGPDEILIKELKNNLIEIGDEKEFAKKIDENLNNKIIIDSSYYSRFENKQIVNKYLELCK